MGGGGGGTQPKSYAGVRFARPLMSLLIVINCLNWIIFVLLLLFGEKLNYLKC